MNRYALSCLCVATLWCQLAPSAQSTDWSPQRGASGAVAILVRTPDRTNGAPPFALLDEFGKVQRYVEPAGNTNLDRYVGKMVRVKHDTGSTLLASQLDLNAGGDAVRRAEHMEVLDTPSASGRLEPIAENDGTALEGPVLSEGQTIREGEIIVDSAEPIQLDDLPAPNFADHDQNCPECELRSRSSVMFSSPCTTCGQMGTLAPPQQSKPHFQLMGELLFFQYYRADGLRTGYINSATLAPDDIDFDYELSPRISAAVGGVGSLGVRTRWWMYDQSGSAANGGSASSMSVDTTTWDIELFERQRLAESWTVEFSGGVRHVEFDELMNDASSALGPNSISNGVDGWGGIIGAELTRSLGKTGNLYARSRWGILQADHDVSFGVPSNTQPPFNRRNVTLGDTTHGMLEIAAGYEYRIATRQGGAFFARAGYEWQHWDNFSTSFTPVTAGVNTTPVLAGPSDVGFGGFALAIGLEL